MFQIPSRTVYDESEKIWRGSETNGLFNPNISVGHVCLYMLSLNPEKVVQISENTGQQLTAGEMLLLAIRVAQNFDKFGYTQNDVLGIVPNNTHFLAPIVLGALLHGVPFHTLDPNLEKGEIVEMFNITKPKGVFCDALVYETVKEALREIDLPSPVYILNGPVQGEPSVEEFFEPTGNEYLYTPPKLIKGGDHLAAIVCSSGTTGLPKGVCLSHYCMLRQFESNLSSDTVFLSFSKLSWHTGLIILITGTLCIGTRIITDRPFTSELFLELIEKYKVNVIFSSSTQMALTIECPDITMRDLSSVTHYVCGGSAIPVSVSTGMEKYIKNGDIIICYGITDIGGVVSIQRKEDSRSGSVGQVALNLAIKIIDDDGNPLSPEEKGEICIRTPYKNLGYYGKIDPITDNQGWVHSGDVGYFDTNGFLYIVDRKQDILKYKNFQYSPTEIEMVIRQIPDVVEVCVFGISDSVAKELPAAAIVKKEGSNLSKECVYKLVAKQMADFKHLRGGVYFVPSLPKTTSGKTLRRKVKEMFFNKAEVIEK